MNLPRMLTLAALLVLAACASPNLRLYEGAARPAADIAVITMPEQLEVASINGAEVPAAKGMWSSGEKRLEVLPGRYEALIYYREVWNVGSDGEIIRSRQPALFRIDAQAGHRYHIDYPRPANVEDARKFAQRFHGWVEDRSSGTRTASSDSGLEFQSGIVAQLTGNTTLVAARPAEKGSIAAVQPLAPTAETAAAAEVKPVASSPAPSPAPQAVPSASSSSNGRDWLSMMKAWWQQASPQERRDFLRWVGEQP